MLKTRAWRNYLQQISNFCTLLIIIQKLLHATGLYIYAALRAARLRKTAVGLSALCVVFSPPHLGQGSMLRIALLPAPNVIYKSIGVTYSSDNGHTWTKGERILNVDYPKPATPREWAG